MKFSSLNISGLYRITPAQHKDARGYFSELFRQDKFNQAVNDDINFVQENFSFSRLKGTVRGLHFQSPPFGQGKLIRCSRGEILDVVVDVRRGSSTYGEHIKMLLSEENGHQLWVPEGFLHGFVSLSDNCEVAYKVTNYYAKDKDGSVLWDDPDLGIDWGLTANEAIVSDKDKAAQSFKEFKTPFSMP